MTATAAATGKRSVGVRRPDLFIVGAAKAGTTSLYEYLNGHPQVFMSSVKEPAYFSPDVRPARPKFVHDRDEAKYLALFAHAPSSAKRLGEASTYYLSSRAAPALIREFSPEARIIVMLRNPIDTMQSMHMQRVSLDHEDITDFAAALEADLAPDRGTPTRRATVERAGSYRERVRYAGQLSRWLEAFGRERVMVLVFEEFFADPAAGYRGVLEFLEVDTEHVPSQFGVHNPTHRSRGGAMRLLAKNPLTSWAARTLLPRTIGADRTMRLSRRFRMSGLTRTAATRSPVSAELRSRLGAELAAEVSELGSILGRDMAAFWFGEGAPAGAGRTS